MDPAVTSYVLGQIKWVVDRIWGLAATADSDQKIAVESLKKALMETRIYFGSQRGRKKRDRNREVELSRLWTEASNKCEPVDSDLAQRCYYKGTYWSDPVEWSDQDIDDASIAIEAMEAHLAQLR